MEIKINIVEILKDKPKGTKLYSSACGKCKLEEVDDKSFKISFYNSKFSFMKRGEGYLDKNGQLYDDGECVVFPSKEMRDWSKFAWQKGDILVNANNTHVIFEKFENDTYTTFIGRHIIGKHYFDGDDESEYTYIPKGFTLNTKQFSIEKGDAIQTYISNVEKETGGKLNLKTLEIEKQLEFKDGDIVVAEGENKGKKIFIFRYKIRDSNTDEHGYKSYINVNSDGSLFNNMTFYLRKDFVYRPATDSEKQQLFEALAKENKAWDAENKIVVDLKPKVKFKPFEKVLVRDSKASEWRVNLFSHKNINGPYYCVYASWNYCIPYEGNEYLLGTTKNVGE